jgi:hypothetical protein
MKIEGLEAIIGIPIDKEDFVIQIYCDDFELGEIERSENKELFFTIFNNPNSNSTLFRLEDLLQIIQKAKHELG